MKKSRFRLIQIRGLLCEAAGGVPVAELFREHGISSDMFVDLFPGS